MEDLLLISGGDLSEDEVFLPPRRIYIDHTKNTSPSNTSPAVINSRSSKQHSKQSS